MYYLATKSELTSIADGIRKVTGKSGKISYPFIKAIDNIQTLSLDNYDTLIGFTYNSSSTKNGMENLPENTYVTFISDPYASTGGIDAFPFTNKEEMYPRFSQIVGITFNTAKSIYSTHYLNQYNEYELIGSRIKEITLPMCEVIGEDTLRDIRARYLNLPKVKTIESKGLRYAEALVSISLPECKEIKGHGMAYCKKISQIFLPKCVSLSFSTFYMCDNLQSISLPVCKTISRDTFHSCNSLSFISLPMLEKVPVQGLAWMMNLHEVYLEKCSEIAEWGFYNPNYPSRQTDQLSIYLNTSTVTALSNINAFPDNTTIYVPESLYSAYILDTNWSPLFSKIISTKNF